VPLEKGRKEGKVVMNGCVRYACYLSHRCTV